MTTAPTWADALAGDLRRLLRDARELDAGDRLALRLGLAAVRWRRHRALRAAESETARRSGAADAARRARDRAIDARFRAGPR